MGRQGAEMRTDNRRRIAYGRTNMIAMLGKGVVAQEFSYYS